MITVEPFEVRASTSSTIIDLVAEKDIVEDCVVAVIHISNPYTDGSEGTGDTITSTAFLHITGTTTATQNCVASYIQDGANPQNTGNRGNNAVSGLMLSQSGGTVFLSDYVIFSTRIANGIRLEANGGSTNFGAEYVLDGFLIFAEPDEYAADVINFTTGSTRDVGTNRSVSLGGFTPDFVLFASNKHALDNVTRDHSYWCFGAASSTAQWSRSYAVEDAATSNDGTTRNSNTRALSFPSNIPAFPIQDNMEVTGFAANQFTTTPRDQQPTPRAVMALAISFKGRIKTYIDAWQTPTSAGSNSYTAAGFKPQFYACYCGVSAFTDNNSDNSANGAQSHSSGFTSVIKRHLSGFRKRNHSSGTTHNYGNETIMEVRNHLGNVTYDGTHTSMDDTGFTWNIVNGAPASKLGGLILIEEHILGDYLKRPYNVNLRM